ncbi:hypothetical protein RYX36_012655, partial [Vicia faba]
LHSPASFPPTIAPVSTTPFNSSVSANINTPSAPSPHALPPPHSTTLTLTGITVLQRKLSCSMDEISNIGLWLWRNLKVIPQEMKSLTGISKHSRGLSVEVRKKQDEVLRR